MTSPKAPVAIYKRADSAEQKNDRRLMILKAAAVELDELQFADDFTIDSLARRLDLSRGTIYLYFNDRNAIFHVLLIDTINRFLAEITKRVSALSVPVTPRTMAHAFCDVLKGNRQLRHLPQLLKSLSKATDTEWPIEKEIESIRHETDAMMVRQFTRLQPGDGRQILHYGWILLLGFSEISSNQTKLAISAKVLRQVEDGLTLIIDGFLKRSE